MSGSHHPGGGITFKAKVVSIGVAGSQVTLAAEPEDIAYFTEGFEFVLHVRPVDNGDGDSGDEQDTEGS